MLYLISKKLLVRFANNVSWIHIPEHEDDFDPTRLFSDYQSYLQTCTVLTKIQGWRKSGKNTS